jgi:hypothetical protein
MIDHIVSSGFAVSAGDKQHFIRIDAFEMTEHLIVQFHAYLAGKVGASAAVDNTGSLISQFG